MTQSLCVVNTRPPPRQQDLTQHCAASGWQVLELCPITLEPTLTQRQLNNWRENLDAYTDIIVTSTVAVSIGVAWLSEFWPQWPVQTQWWAIGPATAKALDQFGIEPQIPNKFDSPALLQELKSSWVERLAGSAPNQPAMDRLNNWRVLVVTGADGLGLIKQQLFELAIAHDVAEVYHRQERELTQSQLLACEALHSHLTALVCTSSKILELLDKQQIFSAKFKQRCYCICASERLCAVATSKGFRKVINSGGASNLDLHACIAATIQRAALL